MEKKHIEDKCCNDCIKYSCNYVITNGAKGYNCPCGCHKELKHNQKHENKKEIRKR